MKDGWVVGQSYQLQDFHSWFCHRTERRGRNAGFTLIEIMVVVFILGLLVTMVAPKIIGRTDEASSVGEQKPGPRCVAEKPVMVITRW